MASRFNFKILNGPDPQASYNAISAKDPMTFYLLSTGVGYMGDIKMFDAATTGAVSNMVTDMTGEHYIGDNTSVASTKAIVDYVTKSISETSIISTQFFRKVESHTLTDGDLSDSNITFPEGCKTGEVGLLFTADTDNDDSNGSQKYFISLKNYLQTVHTFTSTNSVKMSVSASNKVTADLNVATSENSIIVDESGVKLNKSTGISDASVSEDKLVTEKVVSDYVKAAIADALKNVPTFEVDSNN